jgi:ABC-2 type transport system ATP-binding protein
VIDVQQLTKYFGDYAAVRDISFHVRRGQIVGFLGPNGAGKTTTMRILAGFLTATSGSATIDGLDVFWEPLEVRRRIGYMPENCPLYTEMRVSEYLNFRGGIKGLHGGVRSARVQYVLKRCWLEDVRRQLIGTLSKGYRQRVGLADALLASPPVLILDEPTAGLDPTQIRESRKLIRELGEHHTILLSTHILSEVEMTCDSVIIINRGQVAASGSLGSLAQKAGEQTLILAELSGNVDVSQIRRIEDVINVDAEPSLTGTRLRVATSDAEAVSRRLGTLAAEQGWRIHELSRKQQTLEDLFVRIVEQEEPAEKLRAR